MKRFFCFLIFPLAVINSCKEDLKPLNKNPRQEMRDFVIGISQNAKGVNPNFIIVPQNGIELVLDSTGRAHSAYLNAIDGNGQEDLFYGYEEDDKATSTSENVYLTNILEVSKNAGKRILVTDYCSAPSKMDDSYLKNSSQNFISFAADHRELDHVPEYPKAIFRENDNDISDLSGVRNFLYLINSENFPSKTDFIETLSSTNYDLIIIDLFFHDGQVFTKEEIAQLKLKDNGGKRLLLSYMSIGEAENYRYYWKESWVQNKPVWLDQENPNWAGNFKVKYWDKSWRNLIYSKEDSYLAKIMNSNFDGVYLDVIDAFELYE